jgi:hypothetical protein
VTDSLTGDEQTQRKMTAYFEVMRAAEDLLVHFVHANQKELLNERCLSVEAVRGKLLQTVKPKYEDDTLLYNRQNMATRRFTWKGSENTLPVFDRYCQPINAEFELVRHEDICMVATQLDCIYTGLMGSMYGCKWAIIEVMRLTRAEQQQGSSNCVGCVDIWANVGIPDWAA